MREVTLDSVTNVFEEVGSTTGIGAESYTGSFDGRTLFSEGETLALTFPERFVHGFDGLSGTSLKVVTEPSEHADPNRQVVSNRVRNPE